MTDIEPSPDQPIAKVDRAQAIAYHMAALEELAEPAASGEGWTPYCRKLFLSVLAETGRVTTACEYCRLSKQSAYALRARDPIFAAGWDAACELARRPLADALYEQALDGVTDTITRDDGRTITRHRHDSRLSIAVLNRLDRRCDRAAERGSAHLGAVARWAEFVDAIGHDDAGSAAAMLVAQDSAKLSQASQLDEALAPEIERVWWDGKAEEWRTDFPAPPGFEGFIADDDQAFQRALTPHELAMVERNCDATERANNEPEEAERDAYFAALGAVVAENNCVPAQEHIEAPG